MEPIPPEQGAATGPGHELIIEGREELLYLLGEAAELEHSVCCTYLYAAFSLRAEPEAGLTAEQLPVVAGWKRTINQIALQEMIHLLATRTAEPGGESHRLAGGDALGEGEALR